MHGVGRRPCHVQVFVIDIVSVLKAVKKLKTRVSAGKIMDSVFWDSEEVIHVDFHPRDITVNAQYYSNLLRSNVHQAIWEKEDLRSCHRRSSTCMTVHVHIWQI
jgi:hypothetical protein